MEEGTGVAGTFVDALAVAVEAVATGTAVEAYWDTLAAFCDRDGVDAVAQALARRSGPGGGNWRWWRCNLLLSCELAANDAFEVTRELLALEAAGDGPTFDVDRHALEVSGVVRYLQKHLESLRVGDTTQEDRAAAQAVIRAARAARRRAGFRSDRVQSVSAPDALECESAEHRAAEGE